jgi:hypothetical protein
MRKITLVLSALFTAATISTPVELVHVREAIKGPAATGSSFGLASTFCSESVMDFSKPGPAG